MGIIYRMLEPVRGRLGEGGMAAGKMVPLAVSPDGSTIIVREEVFGHDKSNMVELWKISDGKLARVQRWDAVQDDKAHGRDVAGAEFLPDGHSSPGSVAAY